MIEICKKLNSEECDAICSFLSTHLGSNSNWRYRQIFSEFCYRWVWKSLELFHKRKSALTQRVDFLFQMALETPLHPEVFNDRLFNSACHLVKDSVPNIRLTIAKCFALIISKKEIDSLRYNFVVEIVRKMQQDTDSDVRDIVFACELPHNEEDKNNSRNLNETTCNETAKEIASTSTASTVDLNASNVSDEEVSEVSQDSISSFWDSDEKNTSMYC